VVELADDLFRALAAREERILAELRALREEAK